MKGAEAKDQDEFGIAFNEGTGPSQMGAVLCDPAIPPGQILIIGVVQGCQPLHGPNGFDTTPLCPNNNNNYDLPNPGGVFSDWPPVECVVRRATGSMNQLLTGLEGRILGGTNVCPSDVPETDPLFRWGRNYWHRNNNMYDAWNFANPDGLQAPTRRSQGATSIPPTRDSSRCFSHRTTCSIVSIGTDKIYPIVYLGQFYITGWGRMNGGGNLNVDDPCSGGNVCLTRTVPRRTGQRAASGPHGLWRKLQRRRSVGTLRQGRPARRRRNPLGKHMQLPEPPGLHSRTGRVAGVAVPSGTDDVLWQ